MNVIDQIRMRKIILWYYCVVYVLYILLSVTVVVSTPKMQGMFVLVVAEIEFSD